MSSAIFRRPRPRIARLGPGRFELNVPPEERALLRQLLPDLRRLVESGDPSTQRLFPRAYLDDPEKDREYQDLMRGELVTSRMAAIEVVDRSLDERVIDAEGLSRWMEAINSLRLVMGTRLEVGEEPPELPEGHPDAPAYAIYDYLGWMLQFAVEAMSEDLGEPQTEPSP